MKHLVGKTSDFTTNEIKSFTINDQNICVVLHENGFKAFPNKCPHQGVPLDDGKISGNNVVCCLHGWNFDLNDGSCSINSSISLPLYAVAVENNDVFITL